MISTVHEHKSILVMISILVLSILAFHIPFTYAGWLIYHKPAFRGKIIDAGTKEPINGVVVSIFYEAHLMGPAGGGTYIINVKEMLTDKKGEFYIPSYTTLIQPLSIEAEVDFIIYKPAYGSFPKDHTFVIWALSKGLAFSHKISETLKRRVEEAWRREFQEFFKTLPEERRARTRPGRRIKYALPLLPMKDAKERLQALDIPYFTVPDEVDLTTIKWIHMLHTDINLKEDSHYMVIGLPTLTTRKERLKTIPTSFGVNRWAKLAGSREFPVLFKAINEEYERFGLEGIK